MIWFPQLAGGSVAQFPLERVRRWRAISNELESGERISLPDSGGGSIGWRLSYQDLTGVETGLLQALFRDCGGKCKTFAFADPMANLLGWSEDLTRPDWQHGQLQLTASGRVWTLSNSSAGALAVSQSVGVPGGYVSCFSVWVRSVAPGLVTLRRDSLNQTYTAGPVWTRVRLSGTGVSLATQSTYSVEVPAGHVIEMSGPQVEAQPWSSQYKTARAPRGIYPETWFASDELKVTSVGPERSSCQIDLISKT